jgi:hypothetical protein
MHYWSGRRLVVAVVFVGTLAAVPLLGRRADSSMRAGPEVTGFRLESVASELGIAFTHRAPSLDPRLDNVAPHVTALGASVSVTDVNDDGWSDLYFTSSRFGHDNALYVNRGDGTFDDVALAAGVADLNREGEGVSMGAVWGDYDNDGLEDLLVYKYGYLQLLRNTGELSFDDVTEAAGLRRWMNANGAVWLDYDRDGLLDLYVAGYFRAEIDLWHLRTTRIMQNSFEFASNGGANVLFRNLGDGSFADVTDSLGVGSTRWTMAVAAADFNDDGWPDLYLANDYGPEELYENQEGRRFTLSFAGVDTDSKSGMSVSLGDVLNRGRHDVFVTNISERGYLFQGNNLRLNYLEETRRFRASTTWRRPAGSERSRAAWWPTPGGRGARSSVISTTTVGWTCSWPTASSRRIPIGTTGTACPRWRARRAPSSRTRRAGHPSARPACRGTNGHGSC